MLMNNAYICEMTSRQLDVACYGRPM